MQSPISNDWLKVSIAGHYEPQVATKLLLKVSVRELNNIMVSPPEGYGLKEAIYANNNIIISDSTLHTIISPQYKKIYARCLPCRHLPGLGWYNLTLCIITNDSIIVCIY